MHKRLNSYAQTALEYLLLLGLVSFIVFAAFGSNGFMQQMQNSSQDYFKDITRVIMGENPAPIPGGWCEWSLCPQPGGMHYRTCECPSPAFGGAPCPGDFWEFCMGGLCQAGDNCVATSCTCSAGQTCNATTGSCDGPCTPESDAQLCGYLTYRCGTVTHLDNCSVPRTVNCGTCTGGRVCTAGNCVTPCVPKTDAVMCLTAGMHCGSLTTIDNCMNTRNNIDCGTCPSGQACISGNCVVTCHNNDHRGCVGNDVYWYDSCNNQGNFIQTCSGGQTCTNGSCAFVCTPRDHKVCVGNDVYWFDSCNNQGSLFQDCPTGNVCSNGSCNCRSHAIQSCGTDKNVHWFDSCGMDEGVSLACTGGQVCSGNICICGSHGLQKCAADNNVHWYDTCGTDEGVSILCTGAEVCTGRLCVCTPETDVQMCTRLGQACGSLTGVDNCGTNRTADCGGCYYNNWCYRIGATATLLSGSGLVNYSGCYDCPSTCAFYPPGSTIPYSGGTIECMTSTSPIPASACVPLVACGNNIREPGEDCDPPTACPGPTYGSAPCSYCDGTCHTKTTPAGSYCGDLTCDTAYENCATCGDCTCPGGQACAFGSCSCTLNASQACAPDGNVHWYDSCGGDQWVAAWCASHSCSNGACNFYMDWCYVDTNSAHIIVGSPGVLGQPVCHNLAAGCAPYCGDYAPGSGFPDPGAPAGTTWVTCIMSPTGITSADCQARCGDGICTASSENCSSCDFDCGACPVDTSSSSGGC